MIPTGCFGIDKLLGGGISKKVITQVYGGPATGKTNLCLITAYSAAKIGKKVLFVDTEGSFHEKRVSQIFEDKRLLKKIHVAEIHSFEEQKNFLTNLKSRFDLVIVDSMTSLYRVERKEENYQRLTKDLEKLLEILLEYARKNNAAVIITNQVYQNLETKKIEPVGGELLKYYSKVILEMKKEGKKRVIRLVKHFMKKDNEEKEFEIVKHGIICE